MANFDFDTALLRKLGQLLLGVDPTDAHQALLFCYYNPEKRQVRAKLSAFEEEVNNFLVEGQANDALDYIQWDKEYPPQLVLLDYYVDLYARAIHEIEIAVNQGDLAEHMEAEGHESAADILSNINLAHNGANVAEFTTEDIERVLTSEVEGIGLDELDSDMTYIYEYLRESTGQPDFEWDYYEKRKLEKRYREKANEEALENEAYFFLESVIDNLTIEDGAFSIVSEGAYILEMTAEDFDFTPEELIKEGNVELCFKVSVDDTNYGLSDDRIHFRHERIMRNIDSATDLRIKAHIAAYAGHMVDDRVKSLEAELAGKSNVSPRLTALFGLMRVDANYSKVYSVEGYDGGLNIADASSDASLYDEVFLAVAPIGGEGIATIAPSAVLIDISDQGISDKTTVFVKTGIGTMEEDFIKPIAESRMLPQSLTLNYKNIDRTGGFDVIINKPIVANLQLFSFVGEKESPSSYIDDAVALGDLQIAKGFAVSYDVAIAHTRATTRSAVVINRPISREQLLDIKSKVNRNNKRLFVVDPKNFGVAAFADDNFHSIARNDSFVVSDRGYTPIAFLPSDTNNKLVLSSGNLDYIHKDYALLIDVFGGAFITFLKGLNSETPTSVESRLANAYKRSLLDLYGYTDSGPFDTADNPRLSKYVIYNKIKVKKGSNFISMYYMSYYIGLITGRFGEHSHTETAILKVNPLTMVLDSLSYMLEGADQDDPLSHYINKQFPWYIEQKGYLFDTSEDMLYDTLSGKSAEYVPILEILKSYTDELTRPFALLFAAINIQEFAARANPYVEEGDFVGSILTKQNNKVGHYLDAVDAAVEGFSEKSLIAASVSSRDTKLSAISNEILKGELELLSRQQCDDAGMSIGETDNKINSFRFNDAQAPKGNMAFYDNLYKKFETYFENIYSDKGYEYPQVYRLFSENAYEVSLYDARSQINMYYTFEYLAKKTSAILNNWHSGYFSDVFTERVAGKVGGKVDGALVNLTSVFETYHCAEALRKIWSNRNKKISLDGKKVSKNVVATKKKAMPYILIQEMLSETGGIPEGKTAPTPMQYAMVLEFMAATYESVFAKKADFGALVAQSDSAKLYVVTSESGEEGVRKAMQSMSAKGGSICIGQYESYGNATIAGRTDTFTLNDDEEGITGVITVNIEDSDGDITEAKGYDNRMYGSSRKSSYGAYSSLGLTAIFENLSLQMIADAVNAALISHYFGVAHGENIEGMRRATLSDIQAFYSRQLRDIERYPLLLSNDILGETSAIFQAAVVLATQGDTAYRTNITLLKDEDFMTIAQYLVSEVYRFSIDELLFMEDADNPIYKRIKEQIKGGAVIMEPTDGMIDEE